MQKSYSFKSKKAHTKPKRFCTTNLHTFFLRKNGKKSKIESENYFKSENLCKLMKFFNQKLDQKKAFMRVFGAFFHFFNYFLK